MFKHDQYRLEGEEWLPIPAYEGLYEASSMGRIRSVDRKRTKNKKGVKRTWKGRVLKNKTKVPAKEGYKVDLWKDGIPQTWLVARLVCMTFHGVVKFDKTGGDKMTVNHKDGNRYNNQINNIEWMTLADNIRHGFEHGFYPTKAVLLIGDNGYGCRFDSMARASRYLWRAPNYISNLLSKRKNVAVSKRGAVYVVIKTS